MKSRFLEAPKLFLYTAAPIDYFAGFLPADEYFARVSKETLDARYERQARGYVAACLRLLEDHTFYEGPEGCAAGPFVASLPDGSGIPEGRLIVSVKGVNNGTFYLASPFRLPWLEENDEPVIVDRPRVTAE